MQEKKYLIDFNFNVLKKFIAYYARFSNYYFFKYLENKLTIVLNIRYIKTFITQENNII